MRVIKIVLLLILIMVIGFSFKEPNPVGIYINKRNSYTIDSLNINSDGNYKRVIVNKEDNSILFQNIGKWKYENSRILLTNYFPNTDSQEFKKNYNFKSVLMHFSSPLEKSLGRVVFDFNEETGEYTFHKQFFKGN